MRNDSRSVVAYLLAGIMSAALLIASGPAIAGPVCEVPLSVPVDSHLEARSAAFAPCPGNPDPDPPTQPVYSVVRGNIDGIANGYIRGWACSSGRNSAIDVHVYLGAAAGSAGAVMVGGFTANDASEPAVATACGTSGSTFRFNIQIQPSWKRDHGSKRIYVHGISPVGAPNLAIPGSGSYLIPPNFAPAVNFLGPAHGSVFGEGTSTLITAEASDYDDGVPSVTFLVDGSALGTTGSPFQLAYNNISEGAHLLQAYATDAAGAVGYAWPTRTIYGSRVIGDTGVANGTIFGWACSTYVSGSIPVHLYLGGAYGTGTGNGAFTADLASEAAINNQCKGGGTAYRFSIPISDAMIRDHGGKRIYVHGISPVGGANNLLSNAGTYSVPINQPPSVSLTSPGNVQLESPGQVQLTASASDADDAVTQVAFFRNDVQIAVVGAPPYLHTDSGLAAGTYRYHAAATDRRGATTTSGFAVVTVVQSQSPSEVARRYVYDSYQRLCKTIEPESGATVVDYDGAGNVAWTASGLQLPDTTACNRAEAAASGRRVDRGYDARNRVTSLRFPDRNGDQDLVYRNSGELAQVTTWNVQGTETTVNTYQYNKRALLVGESAAATGRPAWSVGYGYDPQGALSSLLYPSGLIVTYANTAQGRPLSVTAGGATYASSVRYHPNGGVKSFTYGNGIVHTSSLTARQLPYEQVDSGAAGFRYHYDGNGNVVGIADLQQGGGYDRTLQYDGNQRLRAAGSASFGGDHWHRYSYDARDNLISASLGGVKDHRYWYDAHNRLTNILDGSGATVTGFTYDAQGNLRNQNGRAHQFDMGNRLRTIQGIETYQYDADGRRTVTSDANGDRLRSLYARSGQLLFEQRRDTGNIEYVQLGSRLLAKREAGTVNYQHVDALGSVVAISNAAGQATERTGYEPYGQAIGKTLDGVGFTGHMADASSGLVYMQQRYYDPTIGRFLSTDPVTAQGGDIRYFNRYAYAANNPFRYVDPDGRRLEFSRLNGATFGDQASTMSYLYSSSTAAKDLAQLHFSKTTYTIVFDRKADPGMAYDHNTRTVTINPTSGLKVRSSGKTQSPALGGGHEIGHAAEHDRIGTEAFEKNLEAPILSVTPMGNGIKVVYDTSKEETRATQNETKMGKELGEPTRNNYNDHEGPVTTCGPTSNERC